MSKGLLAIGMAIALAAAVVGCGGGDDSSGTSSDTSSSAATPLTKAEFIKAADKVCKEGEEELEAEGEEFAEENDVDIENPTAEQKEEVVADVVGPALHKQAEGLAALGAPEGEEDAVEAIVEALEGGADDLESDPATFVESEENPLEKAAKLAGDFGLTECGQ